MRLKWFVPFFLVLGFFALAAIAGVLLAHPAVIGWIFACGSAVWLYVKLLPDDPKPPLTSEQKKAAVAKVAAIKKRFVSRATSSLVDLGLSCRRCSSLALPIVDSGHRYRCAGCGWQFAGTRHAINERFFNTLLDEVQDEICQDGGLDDVLSLSLLDSRSLGEVAMTKATKKSRRPKRTSS